jgi:hypothetical protein
MAMSVGGVITGQRAARSSSLASFGSVGGKKSFGVQDGPHHTTTSRYKHCTSPATAHSFEEHSSMVWPRCGVNHLAVTRPVHVVPFCIE